MTYDLAPFTDMGGGVWCTATWTPSDGSAITATTEDYLNLINGVPALRCGIETAAPALGLELPHDYVYICDEVDKQLARRPVAILRCPAGILRIDLVEPPEEFRADDDG